ncbi:NUMOD4 domain-containing protein [Bacteroides sp. 224]|uniref:NUMOD4 domain-containing protein n=1 Tax=Bacteroides sp. 224 TaxID=2302936 RepID=UPI0013D5AB37|nr:HNH endonuclease [Bacteroides sp. 224]
MGEIWKDIKGFEGSYKISTMGRVKSVARPLFNGHAIWNSKEKILKPRVHTSGYLRVSLRCNNKSFDKYIHILVAQTFIPNTDSLREVDHQNTIRTDNCVDNLRWVSRKENCNNPLTRIHNSKSQKLAVKRKKQKMQ